MHHPTDRIAHTTAFVTPVMEHWLEREIAQWVHPMKDRSDDPSHHERMLLPRRYISLPRHHITINKNVLSVSLNKTLPSFLPLLASDSLLTLLTIPTSASQLVYGRQQPQYCVVLCNNEGWWLRGDFPIKLFIMMIKHICSVCVCVFVCVHRERLGERD